MAWCDEVKSGFSDLLFSFGVPVQWLDYSGTNHNAQALFSEQTVDILGERQQSDNFEIEFDPDDLPGLKRGESIIVNTRAFIVKEDPYVSEDGFTCRAPLKRAFV